MKKYRFVLITWKHSKSNLNAHSFKREFNSYIEDSVNKNCSAFPNGVEGLITFGEKSLISIIVKFYLIRSHKRT